MPSEPEPLKKHPASEPGFLTQTRFESFDLPSAVNKGLNKAGFEHCTPIQAAVLPVSLMGTDVAGQAQTGTGKTAAFLVTLFTRLLASKLKKTKLPSAIIVAPTRELAIQIHEEAKVIGHYTPFRLSLVIGGIDYQKQADNLKKGTDVVICTPGRIIDYFKQKIFKTGAIKMVIIDEADRLLDLGFSKDMRFILSKLPTYDKRQSMLFSATLSYNVLELTYQYMNLPEFISVTPQEITVEGVKQTLYHVSFEEKLSLLLGLLEREGWQRVLIFTNTKFMVEWLAHKLKGNGLPVEGITGDLPQRKRLKLMESFKKGRIKILIATDVASRGIHIEDISHVINYDLPQDPENYVHRIGRTARAGKKGRAISLACEKFVFHLEAIEALIDYQIPVVWPEDDWFAADKCKTTIKPRVPHRRRSDREKNRRPRESASWSRSSKKIKRGPFPGSFFGFSRPENKPPAGKHG